MVFFSLWQTLNMFHNSISVLNGFVLHLHIQSFNIHACSFFKVQIYIHCCQTQHSVYPLNFIVVRNSDYFFRHSYLEITLSISKFLDIYISFLLINIWTIPLFRSSSSAALILLFILQFHFHTIRSDEPSFIKFHNIYYKVLC